ncbi:hypothetical protein G6021_00265 [Dietzia sp. CW19]|uniref:restriction endonuclease subunit S n=1 Tax=Dietzia sp. CW19 TaxID=1630634 RepID=UPI0015F97487|nr:hypothetical protein [Dietzia sp. CW19]
MKTTLGEIAVKNGIQTGPFGSQLHASDYVADGVGVVMPQDLRGNVVSLDEIAFVSSATADSLRRHRLCVGDIVYSRRGDITRRALIRGDGPELLCGTGCLRVRIDMNVADPAFVSYFLGLPKTHEWLYQHAVGATMPNLNTSILSEVPVALPELETQRAIGEVLGAMDDKIAANRQVVGTSVTLATQIIAREAVGSDRPLSEIADVQMGSSPRGAELNEDGDGMEFFQGVRDFGELSPTPRVFATVTPRRAKADATLLAVRAPVGEVNWARNETCIGRGLAAVRSEDAPTTIHYLLRRFACRWDEHEGSGTVFSSVTGPQVKAMQFPTVPEASAGEVEQLLASIHQRALSAEAESEVISRTRDELLPLLMNGRITVKDAERAAEDVL